MKNLGFAVVGVLGIVYLVRQQQRKQFEANVAHAADESVRGTLFQALQAATARPMRDLAARAVQDAIAQVFQGAIGQIVQGAAAQAFPVAIVSVQDAFLQALQSAVVQDAIGQALQNAAESAVVQNAIAPVCTSDGTTGEVTEAHLDARGGQEMNLRNFLDTLGVVVSQPTLQSGVLKVKDLLTSSVEKLVESGIPEICCLLFRSEHKSIGKIQVLEVNYY